MPSTIATLTGLALASLLLAGCAGRDDGVAAPRPLKLKQLTVDMAAHTNENWPARLELVRFEDAALADELLRVETDVWFAGGRQTFERAHPEVLFDSWEVVPGTVAGPFDVKVDGKVVGVLFCGTRTPPPPLRVERDGKVVVFVDAQGCSLGGGTPSKARGPWYWPF